MPVSCAAHTACLGGDVGPVVLYLTDECRLADDMLAQDGGEDSKELVQRGQKLLVEIRSGCEVVVDDGVRNKKDTLIEGLRRNYDSRPKSNTLLAQALASYIGAGHSLSADLATLDDFDLKLHVTIRQAERMPRAEAKRKARGGGCGGTPFDAAAAGDG